jgi:uncharacterized RDD family membrane protein YckC
MHCTKCGEKIEANHLFCNNCGTKIDNIIPSSPNTDSKLKTNQDLREFLPVRKADDAGGMAPAKDGNDVEREKDSKNDEGLAWNQQTKYEDARQKNEDPKKNTALVIRPSFLERVFAGLIDTILNIIIMVIFVPYIPFYMILILILFYNSFMEFSVHGGSLGKMLLNIYFADSDGNRLDFRTAFVHSLLRILSCLFPLIFFFAMNNRCETFHDKITGCVIRKRLPNKKR